MSDLTHFDNNGNPKMVDVSNKQSTKRIAQAVGFVKMKPTTLETILNKNISKGDVLQIARLAGIMASKKTSSIIPLCHPILIDSIAVDLEPYPKISKIKIISNITCRGSTGVEMEALTAVSAAALTVYDMCKSIDRSIEISEIKLIKKSGGKSGEWIRPSE